MVPKCNWQYDEIIHSGVDYSDPAQVDEFVTCDWIMEGLLRQAGFRIDNIQYTDRFGANYICARP